MARSRSRFSTKRLLRTVPGKVISYPFGIRMLRMASRFDLVRRTFGGRRLRMLDGMLATMPEPPPQPQTVRRHLLANLPFKWLDVWRMAAFDKAAWRKLEAWFPITGFETVEGALERGKGVIIVGAHYGGARFVTLVLARRGVTVNSLEHGDRYKRLRAKSLDTLKVIRLQKDWLAPSVFQAQKALKKGEIVHLLPDGYFGQSGHTLPFLGRERRFNAGFAEMAIATGATPVPVFAPIDDRGRVCIEFGNPIDRGTDSMDRDERIEFMIRQYVRLLEQRWLTNPGNALKGHIKPYLSLPAAAVNGNGAHGA